MGFWSKAGKYLGRGAAAVATGGGSEVYRAATGKADPYTAYQERLGQAAGRKVADATGTGGDGPPDLGLDETPEERRRRALREADAQQARNYRDRLLNEPTVGPRAAPTVSAPRPVTAARVGAVAPIAAPRPIVTERVASTFDASGQAESQGLQRGFLDTMGNVVAGTGGPSAAELQMRQGGASAVRQAYAMAGGNKGYSGAAMRNAQRVGASLAQQNVAQTGVLRAQEIANARELYGNAIAQARGQDINLATTDADLALRAAEANQRTGLTAGVEGARNEIEVARANQAAELQRTLTQAGFDQDSIMHTSDQELQVRLANAGFKLSQEQIDDLRAHNQTQARLAATGQMLSASESAANREAQIKQARAQLALAIQQNDQRKQDAALAMLAELGAAYATGGGSAVAGQAAGYDPDAALPLGYTG